ncbi:MAG: electron transfer flavoprotein subunit beta/FixA family protein [Nitrososphaerota archaeon]|nr:electron transfer flavoprotein subunit beta/FixA family protein [Nitrososphaerota archaeon]
MPLSIVVLVKHVYDEGQLKVDAATGLVSLQGVPGKVSTFDRNALEAALRLKQKFGGTVTTLTLGSEEANKSIREALAMGVDNAFLVRTDDLLKLDSRQVVEGLAGGLSKMPKWDIVMCAEGSTDVYSSVIPAMLAEKLDVPYLSYLRSIELEGQTLKGDRSLEKRVVTVECELPAVVSVVSEIYEPRIPTLLQIMAAMKKQITTFDFRDMNVEGEARYSLEGMFAKAVDRKKVMFEGSPSEVASKLVDSMAKEGLI